MSREQQDMSAGESIYGTLISFLIVTVMGSGGIFCAMWLAGGHERSCSRGHIITTKEKTY